MYNLRKAKEDFPWTIMKYNDVYPWLSEGVTGWFDDSIPEGWSDVTYAFLKAADIVLKNYDLAPYLLIEQVKEKFGGGRFYYIFSTELTLKQQIGANIFQDIVFEWETEVKNVCCYCGTRKDVMCYGGWIHYACRSCEKKAQDEYYLNVARHIL